MHSSCSRRTEQSFPHHVHSYSCASLRIRWIEVKVSIHFRRQNSVSKCSKQSGLSRIQYRVEYFGRTWISLPALAHSGLKPQTHERKISRDSVSNAQIVFSNICLDTFCLGNIFVDNISVKRNICGVKAIENIRISWKSAFLQNFSRADTCYEVEIWANLPEDKSESFGLCRSLHARKYLNGGWNLLLHTLPIKNFLAGLVCFRFI